MTFLTLHLHGNWSPELWKEFRFRGEFVALLTQVIQLLVFTEDTFLPDTPSLRGLICPDWRGKYPETLVNDNFLLYFCLSSTITVRIHEAQGKWNQHDFATLPLRLLSVSLPEKLSEFTLSPFRLIRYYLNKIRTALQT